MRFGSARCWLAALQKRDAFGLYFPRQWVFVNKRVWWKMHAFDTRVSVAKCSLHLVEVVNPAGKVRRDKRDIYIAAAARPSCCIRTIQVGALQTDPVLLNVAHKAPRRVHYSITDLFNVHPRDYSMNRLSLNGNVF